MNISLIGLPGSGKSTIGALLASLNGMAFLDTDELIASWIQPGSFYELVDKHIDEFRRIEARSVAYAASAQNAVIATGGGVPLREDNVKALKGCGPVVFVDRPVELILGGDHSGRPLLKNPGNIYALDAARRGIYLSSADYTLTNSYESPQEAAKALSMLDWEKILNARCDK